MRDALCESPLQNHPSIDGNKRGAFAVTFTYLTFNDVTITLKDPTLPAAIPPRSAVAIDDFAPWLRKNTRPGR